MPFPRFQANKISGPTRCKVRPSSGRLWKIHVWRAPTNKISFTKQQQQQQVATNESYVSVLNHCFDDIEKFIVRLQQAFSAARDLQQQQPRQRHHGRLGPGSTNGTGRHLQQQTCSSASSSSASSSHSKRSSLAEQQLLEAPNSSATHSSSNSGSSLLSNGLGSKLRGQQLQPLPPIPPSQAELIGRARVPNGDDYFEILSKFKQKGGCHTGRALHTRGTIYQRTEIKQKRTCLYRI